MLALFWFALTCFVIYPATQSADLTFPDKNNDHLEWPFPRWWYSYPFVIFLILYLYYVPDGMIAKVMVVGLILLTFIFAQQIVKWVRVSSVWCFWSAMLAPILVLVNQYFRRRR